ncbi:MAG: S26 family signal peptidase [Candidatus Phytoplasma pruni]|uniref:S26 family signal peptidase n=1 Tax=Milkweed yellows phytoplasma TaxID=208434 RepID=UPI00037DA485|nr:S26 family signal peptidase [Milkweed yellows phytoplasma]
MIIKLFNKNISFVKLLFMILTNVFYYLTISLLLYLILLNILNYFYPKKASKFLFLNMYWINSESMRPEINKNDIIIVQNLTEKDCLNLKAADQDKKGDDIVFFVEKEFQEGPLKKIPFVVHRVVSNDKEKKKLTTQGINNEETFDFEEKIDYSNALSKVIVVIRFASIWNFMISTGNIIAFLLLGFFVDYFLFRSYST